MTYTHAPHTTLARISPQTLHLTAARLHEEAVKHHRQASLLHEAGDASQADTHGDMAYDHALKAAEASGRALKVKTW